MKTKTETSPAALIHRIRQFYTLLNKREFKLCHEMIDPRLLEKPNTVTLFQYETALTRFLREVGRVQVLDVSITALHVGEPNKLYEGRDFAVGKTTWTDKDSEQHEFAERWVREGTSWYTRSTGLLVPTPTPTITPGVKGPDLIRSGGKLLGSPITVARPIKSAKTIGKRKSKPTA